MREPRRLSIDGRDIAYLEVGSGDPMLLFHGFPDIATTYLPVAERLARRGHRCIMPWLRGYWPSSAAEHYDVGSLVADALGLIDALGLNSVGVVGHDWGADVAYGLSAAQPARVRACVALAVPHPRALGPNRLASFEQLRRSFYVWMFQLPDVAEDVVARDDFAFLRRLWHGWSPGWEPPHEHLDEVMRTLGRPGVARAGMS